MICFRDMAFCSSDCVNNECPRHWDSRKQMQADAWWKNQSGKAPVSFMNFSEDYPEYKKGVSP